VGLFVQPVKSLEFVCKVYEIALLDSSCVLWWIWDVDLMEAHILGAEDLCVAVFGSLRGLGPRTS
jgi:hypothetical protein